MTDFQPETFAGQALQPTPQYVWEPYPDITTYELALCVPVLVDQWRSTYDCVISLPEEAQRHFRRIV